MRRSHSRDERPRELSSYPWWVYPILLAVAALCFDAANRIIHYGPISAGPLDEPSHAAMAALGLLVIARFIDAPGRFYVAALIASVAIDLDHIPLYMGFGAQDQRPVTHSVATVVVFVVTAVVSRRYRAVLAGVAVGLILHFARDIVEGPPGVRMLWPFQQAAWTAGYGWFLGIIFVFLAAGLVLGSLRVPRERWRVFDQAEGRLRSVAADFPHSPSPSAAEISSGSSTAEHARE